MKLPKRLLSIIAATALYIPLWAQHLNGLQPLEEIFVKSATFPNATRAVVSGKEEKSLARKHLDYFQSISVTSSASMETLNRLALELAPLAVEQESYISKGVINYAFYAFTPVDRLNRYLFIFSNGVKTVAMYMEGSASFSEIKKMIKK